LPEDLHKWLHDQAAADLTSMNAQIVRSVRERKERVEREKAAG
jgi:hypothetical protein